MISAAQTPELVLLRAKIANQGRIFPRRNAPFRAQNFVRFLSAPSPNFRPFLPILAEDRQTTSSAEVL